MHNDFALLRRLVEATFIPVAVAAVAAIITYIVGNYTGISEENALLLLNIIYILGLILCVFCLISAIAVVVLHVRRGHMGPIPSFVIYLVFSGIGFIIALFAGGILVLTEGNVP